MMRNAHGGAVLMMLLLLSAAPARGEFQLTSNDRVVLFGDTALVEARTLELFQQFLRTRYPDRCPLVCNLGKMRSTPANGLKRLAREVLPLEPTHVLLCFGLEGDAKKAFNQAKLDADIADLRELALAIRQHGIKVELLTPPPPDEGRFRGLKRIKYRNTVAEFAEAVRELARELDAPVVDWFAASIAYRKNYAGKITPGWTRNGIIPSWYSHAVLADVLLAHWQAEPLDYLITVDWADGGGASATMGKARIVDRGKDQLMLALEGVPVVVNMLGGSKMPADNWPLSKWFHYRIKIDNAPPHGATVSQDGDNPRAYTGPQLSAGADISTSGPLANHAATKALHDAVLRGCNQYSRYFLASKNTAPEPELEEGFRLMHAAEKALVIGAHRVSCRTPARFDITLRIEETFADARRNAGKKDAKPQNPKQPQRRNRNK